MLKSTTHYIIFVKYIGIGSLAKHGMSQKLPIWVTISEQLVNFVLIFLSVRSSVSCALHERDGIGQAGIADGVVTVRN